MREPEIKLFGRKIQLPENAGAVTGDESSDGISDQEQKMQVDEVQFSGEVVETEHQDKDQNPNETEESPNPNSSSQESDENPKTPLIEEDIDSPNNPKSETEQSDSPNERQKTLKKPDKILPCPRCSSMDTKFCYYNNYNVNQPRHFCKSCQRYWTAGGTMRNVPVGSGRRKNKSSSSHSHHITINEALQASYNNGLHHPSFRPNGTVLSFGPDSQMTCEPTALEKRTVKNGYHYKADRGGSVSCKKGDIKNDASSLTDGVKNGFSQPVPWPFQWNSYPIPTFYPHPPPYWNCALPNNAWNITPWLTVPNQNSPNSPLGKHSRNGELLKPNDLEGKAGEEKKNLESSIVVPKTLRIDDPEEAAKSSIWETLGIKYDSAQREGLFKALQPKRDVKKSIASNSSVLQANPAALSRSITFQEGV